MLRAIINGIRGWPDCAAPVICAGEAPPARFCWMRLGKVLVLLETKGRSIKAVLKLKAPATARQMNYSVYCYKVRNLTI